MQQQWHPHNYAKYIRHVQQIQHQHMRQVRHVRHIRHQMVRPPRRPYRVVRRMPGPFVPLVILLGVGAAVLVVMSVMALIVFGLFLLVPVVAAGLAVRAATKQRHQVRTRPPAPVFGPPRPMVAPPLVDPWRRAKHDFAHLRQSYAAYECDPLAVLRLPALADVTVPSTARFIEAFAEAQALDTDAPPPPAHRGQYLAAVERACRAWAAAREAAERIQSSHLPEQERVLVDRIVRLLTTARDSDNDAERLVAYAKARNDLIRLEKTGRFHLPRPAKAMIDSASRGQLPA